MILPPLVFPVKSVYQAQSLKNTIPLEKFYFSQIADRRQYLLFSRLCKHCLWLINICEVFKTALNFDYATLGSAKAHGREPKTCLSRVFNYKLGCFDDVYVFI